MDKYLKLTAAARLVGMQPSAFAKGVRTGRFTPSGKDAKNHYLFDPAIVKRQYDATKLIAEQQNHARFLPKEMQGGRPKNSERNTDQLNIFDGGDNISSIPKQATSAASGDMFSDSFQKAKLARDIAQAQLLKMKIETQSGTLIRKEDVRKQGAELGEVMAGVIGAWPSRLAQEFEAMGKQGCDAHDFHGRISEECNNLIIEIRRRCGYEERSVDGSL